MSKKVPEIRFDGFEEDWEKQKLSKLMDFSNGINASKESYGKGRKMISVMDILSDEPIKYSKIRNSVEVDEKTENNNKVEYGDIVFVRSSEVVEEVGWAKAYLEHDYALYSGFTIRGKKKSDFDAHFFELSLNAKNRKQIERKAGGSTRFNVNQGILRDISILAPKLIEQNKISNFFKQLDEKTALHQHELDLLKQSKKGFLQKMFPKKGESVPELRFPGFSEEWKKRKIKDLGEISTGSTPSTSKRENYSDDGMIWVTPTDIKYRITTNTAKKLSDIGQKNGRIVLPGSILVTSIASIGKNTMVSTYASFNQQINAVTPNDDNDSYFLLTQSDLWSKKMKKFASSGTMQIVNKTEFSNLLVKIPIKEEQTKIGNFFKQLDDSIALHEEKLDTLKQMKKAFLQKMFV